MVFKLFTFELFNLSQFYISIKNSWIIFSTNWFNQWINILFAVIISFESTTLSDELNIKKSNVTEKQRKLKDIFEILKIKLRTINIIKYFKICEISYLILCKCELIIMIECLFSSQMKICTKLLIWMLMFRDLNICDCFLKIKPWMLITQFTF